MNKEIEKKRIGYPRQKARIVLNEYFAKSPTFRLPIPIQEIAESYGFEIYELDNLSKHQRALKMEFSGENRKFIGLNSSYHRHNQRFSISGCP